MGIGDSKYFRGTIFYRVGDVGGIISEEVLA